MEVAVALGILVIVISLGTLLIGSYPTTPGGFYGEPDDSDYLTDEEWEEINKRDNAG